MIEIQNLRKDFNRGKVKAVRDISFTIADNEIFALLGPNGAGKTTTMRMLSTLLTPTAGQIRYDGLPASEEIKKKIGFLTNEIRLDGQFTPNQLAQFYGSLYGLTQEELCRNRQALFSYFGITPFADRKYETFSTGMKQKTSLAICLIHDPQVIIFDEPTNGLDVLTQRLIEDYILQLKKAGKCVILSTHLLDVVERLSDRVGVIIDGKSVFCGTCQEMTAFTGRNTLSDAFISLYEANHEEAPAIVEPPRRRKR
ncbi:MAG: ABC transporter ATP-binding protein [Anaerotignum sp.]